MDKVVQRVAAIHDLCGFGKASLTIVLPVLSAMGIQVCPLPTAVLSTHTGYLGFSFRDLTGELREIIAHWRKLELTFDAIYSGFLGSDEQAEIVEQLIHDFRHSGPLTLVDPVLGDNGKLYDTMDARRVAAMARLIRHADLITPNLTELCLLVGQEYQPDLPLDVVRRYMTEISALGPRLVVVTSVPVPQTGEYSVVGFDRKTGRCWRVRNRYIPVHYSGTGDTFASVLLGNLLRGESFPAALDRAVQFFSLAVQASFGFDHTRTEGVVIERVLGTLQQPTMSYSYELL